MIKQTIKYLLIKIGLRKPDRISMIKKNGGKIGKNVFLGSGTLIDYDLAFLLDIKDNVVIASNSIIELHDSSIPNVLNKGKLRVGRIIIKENAYLGVACTILPGVVIGEGSLIGANSLVNKSIPAGEVWAGVPVKYICKVSELVEKRKNEKNKLIYDIDWIGESSKKEIDYSKFKRIMIENVRKHFNK